MRRTWIALLLSALVMAQPSWAGDGADQNAAAQAPAPKTAKKKAAAARKPAEKSATEALSAEVEKLRQMMEAQQQQLQSLKDELTKRDSQINEARQAAATADQHAVEAGAKAAEAASGASEVKTALAATTEAEAQQNARFVGIEKDADATKKDTWAKIKGIGPFTFSGDIRLRDEPFFGGPTNQSQVRNRERFRLRFNVNAKFNDDISGGFSLASGDLNDPISTNQTTNQFFTKKPFTIDKAFITYTPHQFKPLSLTGGKFAYPWYRTELTWDNDLNPEGLAQTLQWNFKNSVPVLRRFALVGFELPFAEVQHTAGANRSRVQSLVYGGQIQAVWELTKRVKLSTYGGYYNYHNPDAIAFATAINSGISPVNGLLPLGGAAPQNSVYTTTRQAFITKDALGNPLPAPLASGSPTITNAQFASKFGLLDTIARFDITTPMPRVPIVILGDYVQNTQACANLPNLPALGSSAVTATSTSQTTVSRNVACNSRERRGYWLEGRVGRLSEVKDIQVSYTRMFIEREAVVGAFDFSDLRQSSNVSQHRVELFYQAYKNIQLGFTGLFGRPLNFNSTASPEPWLKRLQFDVVYKF